MLHRLFEHKCEYRTRLEALESLVEQLTAENAEYRALVSVMEKQTEELKNQVEGLKEELAKRDERLLALEEKLSKLEHAKDSSNSGIPPSQDPYRRKYPKKEKSGRLAGAQKGHAGSHHPWAQEPAEVMPLFPQVCPSCGSTDLELNADYAEARQEIEIPPIHPFVREYRAFDCQCKHCGKRSRAAFPEHLKGRVQIGPGIEALVLYFKSELNASHDKITQFLQDYLNLSVSHGWIQSVLERSQDRLLPMYTEIIERLKKQPVLHSDETGCPIAGKKNWLWFFGFQGLYVYMASKSRGFKVILELFGNTFSGAWLSDRYNAQLKIIAFHQLCLAHIVRECRWLIESENSTWALSMRELLQKAIHTRNHYGESWNPKKQEVQELIRQYKAELSNLLSKPPPKGKGKKKSDQFILYEQLNRHHDKILYFLDNPLVPPTNNLAERALRCFVTWRKSNGQFQTLDGAQTHAMILSITKSAREQGKNIFDVLSLKQPLFQPV